MDHAFAAEDDSASDFTLEPTRLGAAIGSLLATAKPVKLVATQHGAVAHSARDRSNHRVPIGNLRHAVELPQRPEKACAQRWAFSLKRLFSR